MIDLKWKNLKFPLGLLIFAAVPAFDYLLDGCVADFPSGATICGEDAKFFVLWFSSALVVLAVVIFFGLSIPGSDSN